VKSSNTEDGFWAMIGTLLADSKIIIDRPRGSLHPNYSDVVYPLDYGYLDKTKSADGSGIDIWVGSLDSLKVTGIVVTIDARKRDSEIKILVGCHESEMELILDFHCSGDQMGKLILPTSE